eukprot:CFRG4595T1
MSIDHASIDSCAHAHVFLNSHHHPCLPGSRNSKKEVFLRTANTAAQKRPEVKNLKKQVKEYIKAGMGEATVKTIHGQAVYEGMLRLYWGTTTEVHTMAISEVTKFIPPYGSSKCLYADTTHNTRDVLLLLMKKYHLTDDINRFIIKVVCETGNHEQGILDAWCDYPMELMLSWGRNEKGFRLYVCDDNYYKIRIDELPWREEPMWNNMHLSELEGILYAVNCEQMRMEQEVIAKFENMRKDINSAIKMLEAEAAPTVEQAGISTCGSADDEIDQTDVGEIASLGNREQNQKKNDENCIGLNIGTYEGVRGGTADVLCSNTSTNEKISTALSKPSFARLPKGANTNKVGSAPLGVGISVNDCNSLSVSRKQPLDLSSCEEICTPVVKDVNSNPNTSILPMVGQGLNRGVNGELQFGFDWGGTEEDIDSITTSKTVAKNRKKSLKHDASNALSYSPNSASSPGTSPGLLRKFSLAFSWGT